MIIVGDISGIQNYVFDVAEEGGGQAQRLRARSFVVQLLAEMAALRVLHALKWPLDSVLLSGAGKFLIRGPGSPDAEKCVTNEQRAIEDWLLRETRAELRLTLVCADSDSEAASYRDAHRQLQKVKSRSWAPMAGKTGWEVSRLLLAPLDTPCSLCRHAPAQEDEKDEDTGQVRRVCRTCAAYRRLGKRLPQAHWLLVREASVPSDFELLGLGQQLQVVLRRNHASVPSDFELLGLGVTVTNDARIAVDAGTRAVANLREPDSRPSWCPPEKFMSRRLMAHVPVNESGHPLWFTEIARQAEGDRLLAVLKADADFLGVRFQRLLDSGGLTGIAGLSEQLDAFFAGRLRQELTRAGRWNSIYTIFAGGDDLVMVGPWDVMIRFAGQLRDWFAHEFRSQDLTLSAGLALMKPKRPIKACVAQAEALLESAKKGTKDQLAALGQVWKWRHHNDILKTGRQLIEWVQGEQMERGWLHTLLELVEARHGPSRDRSATSRLAYHVSRNYRKKTQARQWAEGLVQRFDNPNETEISYLPAMVRYALTATRDRAEEE